MKDLPLTLLALVFAFFSLISLLLAPRDSDNRTALAAENSARVSEVGLRATFQRESPIPSWRRPHRRPIEQPRHPGFQVRQVGADLGLVALQSAKKRNVGDVGQ